MMRGERGREGEVERENERGKGVMREWERGWGQRETEGAR